jgi:hypothetical protein
MNPYSPPQAPITAPPTTSLPKKFLNLFGNIIKIFFGLLSISIAVCFVWIMVSLYNEMGGFWRLWGDVFKKAFDQGEWQYLPFALAIKAFWLFMIYGFIRYGFIGISQSIRSLRLLFAPPPQ